MKKLLVIGLIVVGVGLGANPKVRREVSRAWRNMGTWFECRGGGCGQPVPVPKDAEARKAEMKRLGLDIARLANDLESQAGSVADLQLDLNDLQARIKTARADYDKRKADLRLLAQKVKEVEKAGTEEVSFQGTNYPLETARAKMASAFAVFKSLEVSLKSQEKLSAAKQEKVRLAQERFDQTAEQRRALEVQLVQLETTEEQLGLDRMNAPLPRDQGAVEQIKNRMGAVKRSQDKEQYKRKLLAKHRPDETVGLPSSPPAVDTDEVIRATQGAIRSEPPVVADNKKSSP